MKYIKALFSLALVVCTLYYSGYGTADNRQGVIIGLALLAVLYLRHPELVDYDKD